MFACSLLGIIEQRYEPGTGAQVMWCIAWLLAKHMSAITNLRHEALRDVADADANLGSEKVGSDTSLKHISLSVLAL